MQREVKNRIWCRGNNTRINSSNFLIKPLWNYCLQVEKAIDEHYSEKYYENVSRPTNNCIPRAEKNANKNVIEHDQRGLNRKESDENTGVKVSTKVNITAVNLMILIKQPQ